MTKEQLKEMGETISMPLTMRSKDDNWKEAFKEYNEDAKRAKSTRKSVPFLGSSILNTSCEAAYMVVHRYLEFKSKKTSVWRNVVKN